MGHKLPNPKHEALNRAAEWLFSSRLRADRDEANNFGERSGVFILIKLSFFLPSFFFDFFFILFFPFLTNNALYHKIYMQNWSASRLHICNRLTLCEFFLTKITKKKLV
jgi:hypothetical protein